MKRLLRFVFISIFLFTGIVSQASHLFGGDFYYEYISGNTYRLTLTVYGDCSGSSFGTFTSSSPEIKLYDGSRLAETFSLTLEGPGVEVSPVCARELINTTCNNGVLTGVKRFIYSTTVTLPGSSADWLFRFTGNMGISTTGGALIAGRSNGINNIVNLPVTAMILEAKLNNLNGNNSSPRFTTIPTPFYCVNSPQQYNQGAIDPNGDSLVYSLAPALDISGPVAYNPGFSPTDPLGLGGTGFMFNTLTGQMNFTATFTQKSVIVNKVTEYRKGVIVGTAMREMTFVILATCNNQTPAGRADTATGSFSGGVLDAGSNVFSVCEGSGTMHFSISATDPDGDNINMVANGIPAGATFSITNNNTRNPAIGITWNMAGVAAGNYNFFLTYIDDGCPFSSQQTQAYTIRVLPVNSIGVAVVYPTECAHNALVRFTAAGGPVPRTLTIRQGTAIVRTLTDNTGMVTDSLPAGNYTVTVISQNSTCSSQAGFTVRDSGVYPYPPVASAVYYCKDAPSALLMADTRAGSNLRWYDASGIRLAGPPVPNTAVTGVFKWYVSAFKDVCESEQREINVYVTPKPIVSFTASPDILCTKDTLLVTFTGTTGNGPLLDYIWNWDGANYLQGTAPGPWKVKWLSGSTKTITLQVVENKCPGDTASQQIRVKETPGTDFSRRNICLYDTLVVDYLSDTLAGQQYAWSFDGASSGQSTSKGPFRLHWTTPGIKHLFLTVTNDGCVDTISRYPEVYPVPKAVITTVPGTVCLGDKIYLTHAAIGQDAFKWTPADRLSYEPDGLIYTHVSRPVTYMLTVTNVYNCTDSATITYDHIEPCCNFSYPTAFTPNNDGRNDIFHVITYGNDEDFSLSIYNRWGQRVYHSGNPKEGWDGTMNGKECDMGTYFYVLKAKCLTGHEENQKGELTLIR